MNWPTFWMLATLASAVALAALFLRAFTAPPGPYHRRSLLARHFSALAYWLVILLLICGFCWSVAGRNADKADCRGRGGVPVDTGRHWFCAAPDSVR